MKPLKNLILCLFKDNAYIIVNKYNICKIISHETIKPLGKDLIAKCY